MKGRPRYTERAMSVLTWAQEEARVRGADAMDTEHILLGLLRQPESLAVQVMKTLGIDPKEVYDEINRAAESKPASSGVQAATPYAKKVIQHAADEATTMGHF